MKKTFLILHGWLQPVTKESIYYKYFEEKGYSVVAPQLFTKDFVLTKTDARAYIESQLGEKKPEVIVEISLGGLLVPVSAKNYPNAKLIFIATGAKSEPKATGFRMLLSVAKNKRVLNMLLNVIKFLPQRVLFAFYEFINPFRGNGVQKLVYIKDMKDDFKYIIGIPVEEESEIVNFVTSTDNTELLKTLKNRAIIFTSNNDLMMPSDLGQGLHKLLASSKWAIKAIKKIKRLRVKDSPKLSEFGYIVSDAVERITDGIKDYFISAVDARMKFGLTINYKRLTFANMKDFYLRFRNVYPGKIIAW